MAGRQVLGIRVFLTVLFFKFFILGVYVPGMTE